MISPADILCSKVNFVDIGENFETNFAASNAKFSTISAVTESLTEYYKFKRLGVMQSTSYVYV